MSKFWGPMFPDAGGGHFWGPDFPDRPGIIFGPTPVVAGFGPAGAGTFALVLENGFEITYGWITDLQKSYSGLERRASRRDTPKQTYRGSAFLVGGGPRATRSKLARYMATGREFLLALPHEALTLSGDATGSTLFVGDTTTCDWLQVDGQRAIVMNGDNSASCVVQAHTTSTISIDVDATDIALDGASIMPAMAVLLEAEQSFDRFMAERGADGLERWQITARASVAGFAGFAMGAGVILATHASRPVWDRGVDVEEQTASDSIHALTEVIDMDGRPLAVGNATAPDWGRSVAMTRTDVEEQHWLMAFLAYAKGRCHSWWLPTLRADLVPVSIEAGSAENKATLNFGDVSAGPLFDGLVVRAKVAGYAGNAITVTVTVGSYPDHGSISETGTAITIGWHLLVTTVADIEALLATSVLVDLISSSASGGSVAEDVFFNAPLSGGAPAVPQRLKIEGPSPETGDFFAWYPSQRSHLQISTLDAEGEETITRAQITGAVDDADGTITLDLDVALPSGDDVAMVSWLELCRFESDDIVVAFNDAGFSMREIARVVQR